MLTLITLLLLAACGEPDPFTPTPDDTGTGDGGTAYDGGTEDGGTPDGGTDTGTEVTGGNCGGPEPPPDEGDNWWWICENGSNEYEGYTWPIAGGPEDLDNCQTAGNFTYEIGEGGYSVTLTREDGWVLICELDE